MITTVFNQGLVSSPRSLPSRMAAVHGSVHRQVKAISRRFLVERARRATARTLAAGTDHDLDDLGLHRGQIRIVRNSLFD